LWYGKGFANLTFIYATPLPGTNTSFPLAQPYSAAALEAKMFGMVCCTAPSLLEKEKENEADIPPQQTFSLLQYPFVESSFI